MPTPRSFGQATKQTAPMEPKESSKSSGRSTPQWLTCMQRTPRNGSAFQQCGARDRESGIQSFDLKEMEAYIKDIHWVAEKTLAVLHETSERSLSLLEDMQLQGQVHAKVFETPAQKGQGDVPPGLREMISSSVREAIKDMVQPLQDRLKQEETAELKSMEHVLKATIKETAECQRRELQALSTESSQGIERELRAWKARLPASQEGLAINAGTHTQSANSDATSENIYRLEESISVRIDALSTTVSSMIDAFSVKIDALSQPLMIDSSIVGVPLEAQEASQWRQRSGEKNGSSITRAVANSLDSTDIAAPPVVALNPVEEKAGGGAVNGEAARENTDDSKPSETAANGTAQDFKRNRMKADEEEYLADQQIRGSGEVAKPPKLKEDTSFASVFVNDTDLAKPIYDVETFYKTSGMFQSIARNASFSHFSSFMVVVNAVFIGIDSDYNEADNLYDANMIFIVSENIFCLWFTIEWVVRFMAFARTSDAARDGWMRFDFVLVAMMILETWVLMPILKSVGGAVSIPVAPLRLLRLLKLTRMARMMSAFPELVTMVKGVARSLRAISGTFLLVVLLLYTFAILIHMLLKEEKEMNVLLKEEVQFEFTTMPHCMWTLFMCGVFMLDGAANLATFLIWDKRVPTSLAGCIFLLFTFLSAMTVLQMLIGVLCEVVSDTNKEHEAAKVIAIMKQQLVDKLRAFDDGDGKINQTELQEIMRDPECKALLRSLRINRLFLLEQQRLMFPNPDSSVAFKPLTEMMLQCRGDNSATVETMASGFSYLVSEIREAEQRTIERLMQLEARV